MKAKFIREDFQRDKEPKNSMNIGVLNPVFFERESESTESGDTPLNISFDEYKYAVKSNFKKPYVEFKTGESALKFIKDTGLDVGLNSKTKDMVNALLKPIIYNETNLSTYREYKKDVYFYGFGIISYMKKEYEK